MYQLENTIPCGFYILADENLKHPQLSLRILEYRKFQFENETENFHVNYSRFDVHVQCISKNTCALLVFYVNNKRADIEKFEKKGKICFNIVNVKCCAMATKNMLYYNRIKCYERNEFRWFLTLFCRFKFSVVLV